MPWPLGPAERRAARDCHRVATRTERSMTEHRAALFERDTKTHKVGLARRSRSACTVVHDALGDPIRLSNWRLLQALHRSGRRQLSSLLAPLTPSGRDVIRFPHPRVRPRARRQGAPRRSGTDRSPLGRRMARRRNPCRWITVRASVLVRSAGQHWPGHSCCRRGPGHFSPGRLS